MEEPMFEVFQPWTNGYWVALTEHDPTYSNIFKYGFVNRIYFENIDIWVHELTESTIGSWLDRNIGYISKRASHILTSLSCVSGVATRIGGVPNGPYKLQIIGPDEYWERTTLGKQKKLTFWWKLDDRTSLQGETK